MRHILVLNAKGGCGKSTIATNLASYYAWEQEKKVALADFDPQGSSLAWLGVRGEEWPAIEGIAAWKDPVRPSRDTDVVIMDAPARVHGSELTQLVRRAETIVFPVLPSPIDMRAAEVYMQELQATGRVQRGEAKIGVIANRVRENTIIYAELYEFLRKLNVPYITTLRDTQNYIKAEERGVGIYEMAPSQVWQDIENWEPMVKWLNSKRSMP
ncbi:MAG: ParA family protein [Gammaproteobacteria bacterium]|jgi:chromosome partitioning protein